MIEISSTAMVEALDSVLLSKLTPMLVGSPGIGKSDIVKLVAKKHNLKLIDVRLAQSDPTDLNGFPTLQSDDRIDVFFNRENLALIKQSRAHRSLP